MAKEILTSLQKGALKAIFENPWFRQYFYLTGGTALSAFHLFHRFSDDLDFFSHHVSLDAIDGIVRSVAKKMQVPVNQVQKSPQFIRYELDASLKLDFVGDVSFRVGSPQLVENFMVDCLENISVNKVGAILGRFEPKDYVDLYFIFKDKSPNIMELLELGARKDAGLDPFVWASLIGDAEQLPTLPRMIRPVTLEEIKNFYRDLRNQIIDHIRPRKS